jgi:glycosyltransferase involved in cell wall biosynthesis
MAEYDLSILIPARNEMFLANTIDDILKNIEGKTEIIAVLDGYKPEPPLLPDPRVLLIYNPESKGQRAATNQAARLSKAKYVMKVDAHCAFDKGFDVKMMEAMQDDWTMAPTMKNLHAFDWVCPDGHRRYQGPSGPCNDCGKETTRDVVWIAKRSPNSISYCFDSSPHFQYFGEYSKRPEGQGDITESMSLQGSCFMLTREKYWELGICDEEFGSWGSQGIEVAAKTWLSGGRVMIHHNTWYAHMFRTQGGDFSFPYPISGRDQEKAKRAARDLFFNDKWPLQKRPLSWLVEKFWPVKGWTEEDLAKLKNNTFTFNDTRANAKLEEVEPQAQEPQSQEIQAPDLTAQKPVFEQKTTTGLTKGIIYYSDSQLPDNIAVPVRNQLAKISQEKHIPIVSATLKKLDFGDKSIRFPSLKRGYPAMFKQIMAALEHSTSDIIFFCEHDVLYHPSHFDFTPEDRNTFYYNQNVWYLRLSDGEALHYDVNQLSGLCGYREELLTHFTERYEKVLAEGFSRKMGFEPMTHKRIIWKNMFKADSWKSERPNIDIRHDGNLTSTRWYKSQFRNQKLLKNWKKNKLKIYGWGRTYDLLQKFR